MEVSVKLYYLLMENGMVVRDSFSPLLSDPPHLFKDEPGSAFINLLSKFTKPFNIFWPLFCNQDSKHKVKVSFYNL